MVDTKAFLSSEMMLSSPAPVGHWYMLVTIPQSFNEGKLQFVTQHCAGAHDTVSA